MYVLDASVAVKWYVEEEGSEQARSLLVGAVPAIAPAFLAVELTNVMAKLVRRSAVTLHHAQLSCLDLPVHMSWWIPDVELLRPALDLSIPAQPSGL